MKEQLMELLYGLDALLSNELQNNELDRAVLEKLELLTSMRSSTIELIQKCES